MVIALIMICNKFIDAGATFDAPRAQTSKEWQAVVLTDMLPAYVYKNVLAAVRGGSRKLYTSTLASAGFMPVEFSTEAFRLFHSRALSAVGGDQQDSVAASSTSVMMMMNLFLRASA